MFALHQKMQPGKTTRRYAPLPSPPSLLRPFRVQGPRITRSETISLSQINFQTTTSWTKRSWIRSADSKLTPCFLFLVQFLSIQKQKMEKCHCIPSLKTSQNKLFSYKTYPYYPDYQLQNVETLYLNRFFCDLHSYALRSSQAGTTLENSDLMWQ